jgi:hypothetical protein
MDCGYQADVVPAVDGGVVVALRHGENCVEITIDPQGSLQAIAFERGLGLQFELVDMWARDDIELRFALELEVNQWRTGPRRAVRPGSCIPATTFPFMGDSLRRAFAIRPGVESRWLTYSAQST